MRRVHDGGVTRRRRRSKCNRIGLGHGCSLGARHEVVVERPFLDPRDECLPDAGGSESSHRYLPVFFIAGSSNYGNSLGVGGPDRKAHACQALDVVDMSAELVEETAVLSLGQKLEVVIVQGGRKRCRGPAPAWRCQRRAGPRIRPRPYRGTLIQSGRLRCSYPISYSALSSSKTSSMALRSALFGGKNLPSCERRR